MRMITVRRSIRWITALVKKPFTWFQGLSKPRRIASQLWANGARLDVMTHGLHSITYHTGDYVLFGKGSEVIEIRTHDGIKWRKSNVSL